MEILSTAARPEGEEDDRFAFRPWVGRAGMSILAVGVGLTVLVIGGRVSGGGWASEPAVLVYLALVWAGAVKIYATSRLAAAQLSPVSITLRPLHQFFRKEIPWERIVGIEQMIGGDRLLLYYYGSRGQRFVAMNLNLIRGRREFLAELESRLRTLGFEEKLVDRSRYLTRR